MYFYRHLKKQETFKQYNCTGHLHTFTKFLWCWLTSRRPLFLQITGAVDLDNKADLHSDMFSLVSFQQYWKVEQLGDAFWEQSGSQFRVKVFLMLDHIRLEKAVE